MAESGETLLEIDGVPLPLGSSRDLRQTLEPIDSGELVRTWNGDLVDLTRPAFRKYAAQISGDDLRSPAFDALWKGQEVTVRSFQTLRVPTTSTTLTLPRVPASGSVRAYDPATIGSIAVTDVTGRDVTLESFSGTAVVEFRPVLQMRITGKDRSEDEWAASERWSIDLEEL